MNSPYSFVVSPIGGRYNNTMEVGDKSLIVNTEVFNHQFSNRTAKVISVPSIASANGIKPGDTVILHHNVFRRWHDVRGNEQNSRSFFSEDKYFVGEDQLYIYKQDGEWKSLDDYCFVKPIANDDMFSLEKEKPLVGIVKYSNDILKSRGIEVGDKIGFIPNSEFEFVIDGERVYRVRTKVITIKYEYEGEEREYNPSWL